MQAIVTARASKPAAPKHNVRRMEIEPADNGFIAHTHLHPTSKDDPYPEPERKLFLDPEDLGAHVAQTMGGGKKSKSKEKDAAKPKGSVETQPKQGKEKPKASPDSK